MEGEAQSLSLPFGKPVQTACKGYVLLEQNTPRTLFKGRMVYFCLSTCLETFLHDPKTSCLAGDLPPEEK